MKLRFVTARKRSLGQGNIFTPVCHSVHRGGVRGFIRGACVVLFGGVCGFIGGRAWFYLGGVRGYIWGEGGMQFVAEAFLFLLGGMHGFIRRGFIWGGMRNAIR